MSRFEPIFSRFEFDVKRPLPRVDADTAMIFACCEFENVFLPGDITMSRKLA
jgi:hypothetical protein